MNLTNASAIRPSSTMTVDSAARRLRDLHPESFDIDSAKSRIRAAARDLRIPLYLLGDSGLNFDRAEAFELIDMISEMTAE